VISIPQYYIYLLRSLQLIKHRHLLNNVRYVDRVQTFCVCELTVWNGLVLALIKKELTYEAHSEYHIWLIKAEEAHIWMFRSSNMYIYINCINTKYSPWSLYTRQAINLTRKECCLKVATNKGKVYNVKIEIITNQWDVKMQQQQQQKTLFRLIYYSVTWYTETQYIIQFQISSR
jgi:hypothetical protein